MQVTAALADTYRGPWVYAPGAVFADLAAAVADGADCIDGVGQLCGDREHALGPRSRPRCGGWSMSASTPPICRGCGPPELRRGRRRGLPVRPRHAGWLHLDVDATIMIDHSDNKVNAAPTWKKTFGFHPLLAFLDRPDIAGGEALAGLLRAGNAGSNTAADHISVLDQALASLPPSSGPTPKPRRAAGVGPLRLCRRHLRVRRGLPENGGGVLPGWAIDARVRRTPKCSTPPMLVPAIDRRRRHPRRGLGG